MQASKNLRIVAKFTIGVDDVDVDAATEMGILVTHGPTESNWGGVAEGTITNMLTLLKKTRERDRYLKTTSGWRDMKLQGTFVGHREEDGYPGITLGIIGLGRIGSRVAKLMRPWGMKMIGYDPYVPDSPDGSQGPFNCAPAWQMHWRQSIPSYRNPAFTGDATFLDGEVVDIRLERRRHHIAVVNVEMRNQDDSIMAKATVEVELPAE